MMPAPRIAKIRIRTGDCLAHDTPAYRVSLAPASYGSGRCEASLVPLVKRSLTLHGHRTSLALEPEFWDALDAMAARDGVSPTVLTDLCLRLSQPAAASKRRRAPAEARALPPSRMLSPRAPARASATPTAMPIAAP